MKARWSFLCLLLSAFAGACADSASGVPGVDPLEQFPGGETTNTLLLGSNAFLRPAPNLTNEESLQFFSGNGLFNQAWVEAPASTAGNDGLGPIFNARSCSGCHFKDGKGTVSEAGGPLVGLLFRLSIPGGSNTEGHSRADPVYGGQLQDQGLPGVPEEGSVRIDWETVNGTYSDGAPYSLRKPIYTLEGLNYGPTADGLMVSPRLAPHMVGLGLLEAIPAAAIEALADPEDIDADGVSGRAQSHATASGPALGRFGWKADAVSIPQQVANAFAGDMGLTTPLNAVDDCTTAQSACTASTSGGSPEVADTVFERVVLYSRTIAVPIRRAVGNPEVLEGRSLFYEVGCATCHTPSHKTGDFPITALAYQTIWPYTDLLLHDMGEELADGRPVGVASGREWKTPPLWALGLIGDVSGGTASFLHDGRARSLEEAILWHGGEAQSAADRFKRLTATERSALIRFVEDL